MTELYPPIDAFDSGFLPVSDLHTIHYEQSGNPQGRPVVLLHGGPGGGMSSNYRRYFNPEQWRIIQFSQRGCGQSTPFAELRENTTWDLVADIEKLREYVGVERWSVFGGSWGSTLSLSYSQSHPERCEALFLRGIFLLRKKEIDWFYQSGCSKLYPDAWERYIAPIPDNERDDLLGAFHRRLTSDDEAVRNEAARAWSVWEASTSKLVQDEDLMSAFGQDKFAVAFARIECHYFTNKGFFENENQLLENVDRIRHIPAIIVQGRYDVVCPPESAWELSKVWPEAQLHIIQTAGHSMAEPGIAARLVEATDSFASNGTMPAA
ncbi:MAG: prolyl aminopeptidase [Gammaproteobacteria bacterium]|nr:prolyl aminopeptidase [Gammaproteobacteria bacterium]